ncbi:MAG: NADP-dependent oxidoreductase [Microbacterium sp.]
MAWHWIAAEWGGPENWRFAEYAPPEPGRGEVTIQVRAAGVNPADAKHVAAPRPSVSLPVPIGYEVSGELIAVGPDTRIGSGDALPGDEVVAFRIRGGYATEVTVPASAVFRKPSTLSHPEAANLLLAGTTAAEMLAVTGARAGEAVLLHGASGAVGVSVLQLAAHHGIRVIGTASPQRADTVRRFGGIAVSYGPGLEERVRAAMAEAGIPRIDAALDAVGTDEAVDVSLGLVPDRARIVTIAASSRARDEGFSAIAGLMPDSARFRDATRAGLIDLAERGLLTVPVARTFPLAEAGEALRLLAQGHPGGAFALVP